MTKAGIYIHIPFCTVKCLYCDFYSITEREDSIQRFINAITKEIETCNADVSKWAIDTIFIGGGTPSLLNGTQIEKIISALSKKYDLSNLVEFTIEVNPGEAPIEHLKLYKDFGINRLSIGVQSLQPELLKFLTRIHDRKKVFQTYNNARDIGYDNINIDLIHSIPGQTLKLWKSDLEEILKLKPEHISAYSLTVEKGTELFGMVKKKIVLMPKEEINAKFFENTIEKLTSNGYSLYEISNFSKPGLKCKHNIHYWNIEPYLGFGPSAHSFDSKYRWNNTKSLDTYLKNIESNRPIKSNVELLSKINKLNETIGFGLRMSSGINLNKFPKEYRNRLENRLLSANQKFKNCLKKKNHRVSLSNKGFLFADEIIVDLIF